jgi:DNA repair protein RecO (recombination protein O)
MTSRDNAILLAAQRAGADGRFLTFLTREKGLAKLYYRRFRRRVRVEFLDALQQGELMYSPASDVMPGRLHSFHCEQVWPGIRSSLEKLVCALQLAETAALLASEEEPTPEMYDLLLALLGHLERGGDTETLRILFILRALQAAGFAPGVERCFVCQRGMTQPAFFAPQGGAICAGCRRERGGASRPVSPGALSVMRRSLLLPLERVDRLKVGKRLGEEILPLLQLALETALDVRPKSTLFSTRIGRGLRRNGAAAL